MSKKIIKTAQQKARNAGYMASWCAKNNQDANIWYDEKMNLVKALSTLEVMSWDCAYVEMDSEFNAGMLEQINGTL